MVTSIGSANSNTLIPTAATNACCLLLKGRLIINGSVFTTAVVPLDIPESGLFADVVKRLKYDKFFFFFFFFFTGRIK